MKNIVILILIVLYSLTISAQTRNSVWVFGDSAGIDFSNTISPQVFLLLLIHEVLVFQFLTPIVIYYFMEIQEQQLEILQD
ncbi:MAG: hypothetical protein IPP71_01670 [Bacteroidetes bacterium]|nr:hypothetical protein [Bacteroidota bacterium]